MFSLCSNFLDFALLSQGQFLVNGGEETEKLDFLKAYSQHTQSPFFSFHSKIGFVRLVGASPKPQKAKNGTRFAPDLLKAKTHDS